MKFRAILKLMVLTSIAIVINPSWAEEDQAVTVDGLRLLKDSNLALVYAEPGVDLSQYKRIYLSDAYIAFKKHWRRTQNNIHSDNVSVKDMEKIRVELSSLFRDVFSKTLEDGGYQLVTEHDEDVLLIKPAIINLDIIAPDTRSATHVTSFTQSAGEMTLYLELYDSMTGDLIAKALDRQEDRQTGYFQWQNRVSNRAAANRILQVWANVLKQGLDQAQSP
jgi:hypothetical protein